MKLFSLGLWSIIAASLFTLGCKNIPPVTAGLGTDKIAQGDDFSRHLQVHNTQLAKQLQIINVNSRKTNDLLEINLQLTSSYKKSLQLQYHFNWFDADGFVVESRKTPWKPLALHGYQSTTLRGLAPSIKVSSFSIYVREVPKKAFKF